MANIVWHEKWGIEFDLTREDLGHESISGLWELLYNTDRMDALRGVPVSERGLRCGGVCRKAGVVAWMYLRERNGRREAVHERSEDEERHQAPLSDEHKAYQERIVRTAESAGFRADSEVRTSVGPRSWIQTDTLVQGEDGLRIGWEVQLSSAGMEGPRSVKARAGKAAKYGITPAWHTDRQGYASRNDTHWTRSDNLPAHVIAKSGDLRVVSGFRVLDFWRCDNRALYRCQDTSNRCGKLHVTPKPRDVFFDDLVRQTAAGLIVPIEHRTGSRTNRFWVPEADRDRLDDLNSGREVLPSVQSGDEHERRPASHRAPTCRPSASAHPQPVLPSPVAAASASVIPQQPVLDRQPAEHRALPLLEQQSNSDTAESRFPEDLIRAQVRLHQATAELAALVDTLPWSVEPHEGWLGTSDPHTGVMAGGREPSPGWTADQRATVERLRTECAALSVTVGSHAHWASLTGENLVRARQELKAVTKQQQSRRST